MVESQQDAKLLDLNSTVNLILHFMKESNLLNSMDTLIQETGVHFPALVSQDFIESVRRGQWHQVLKQMQHSARMEKGLVQGVYEQIVKELIIEREYVLAQQILREQSVVLSESVYGENNQLVHGEGALLQELWDLTQLRDPPPSIQSVFKRQGFKTLQESREHCASQIEKSLSKDQMPANRLLQLLALGLEYENQLKGGKMKTTVMKGAAHQQFTPYVQKIITHKLFSGSFKISTLSISNNCEHMVLGGHDGLIEVWSYEHMSVDLKLPYQQQDLYMLHSKCVLSLAFSKDDKILASADSSGVIRVWKFAEGKKLREIEVQGGGSECGISSMVFATGNSQLIAGCMDKSIRVYGLKSGSMLKQFKGHDSFIQSIQLLPGQEQFLLSSAEDGVILLWNLQGGEPRKVETPAQKLRKELVLNCFRINPSNPKEVLISHRCGSTYLIDLDTSQVLQEYQTSQSKEEEVISASFSHDGSHVYAFSSTKNLYIYNKKTGKLVSLLVVPSATSLSDELSSMVVASLGESETMVMHSMGELFKLE
ncbi:hypothetical protein FGO68_gene3514 [Halteria grandinella]|uniref:WD40 repeat-containing protein SMU1 n=1 Tax=Halteria grandinella TaxID=5974 RepID=A0A8J8P5X0_HALGN|nr:hypothetical protein FGO68_gene3514 [Halteria grandinella]